MFNIFKHETKVYPTVQDDHNTRLYNCMAEIEANVYSTCNSLMLVVDEYVQNYGVPVEWSKMSTQEWYDYYNKIEDDNSDKSTASKAYFRLITGWDFLGDFIDTYMWKAQTLLDSEKKAWGFIDRIVNRSLVAYRHANSDCLHFAR